MNIIKVRGHEFNSFNMKDSSSRKAIQLKNNIENNLKKIGINKESVNINIENFILKKVQASASWYYDGQYLYYSYNKGSFIENLYIVSKVIELELESLEKGKISNDDFIRDFTEDKDIELKRKEARELLGIEENSNDWELIHEKYKKLAKEHHPDLGGDLEKFKEINNAHKMLKRELL